MGIGKKILLVIGIILLVVIIVGVGIYFSITSSNIISAQIHIESGKVLVNGNELVGDSTLKEGDIIETKEDGKATVILYESVIINLDSNTKVTLDSLVKENPRITREELARLLGITPDGVKYHLDNMKKKGLIRRVGGRKEGHWEIIGK